MKDKEMIEEIAKVIDSILNRKMAIGNLSQFIAVELSKHYQPKLPKDSVVLPKSEYNDLVESKRQLGYYIEDQAILLQGNIPQGCIAISREEYDCLKKIEKSYDPFWFCSFGGCEGVCKECKDNCEMSIFVKERKETAEKIKSFIFSRLSEATDDLTRLILREIYWEVDELFCKTIRC